MVYYQKYDNTQFICIVDKSSSNVFIYEFLFIFNFIHYSKDTLFIQFYILNCNYTKKSF